MTILLPHCDVYGNGPVSLLCIVSDMSISRKYTSFSLVCGCSDRVSVSPSILILVPSSAVFAIGFVFVDQMPCLALFMCPFFVSIDSGKCLIIIFTVRPGRVAQFPLQMASRNVSFSGHPAAAWYHKVV